MSTINTTVSFSIIQYTKILFFSTFNVKLSMVTHYLSSRSQKTLHYFLFQFVFKSWKKKKVISKHHLSVGEMNNYYKPVRFADSVNITQCLIVNLPNVYTHTTCHSHTWEKRVLPPALTAVQHLPSEDQLLTGSSQKDYHSRDVANLR